VKEWERHERDLVRRRGASRQAGSGSGWRQRNDGREGTILWEAKQTSGISISVKKVVWSELRRNALLDGRMPALALRIQDLNLVVISQDDFDERWPPDVPG
jgi:hypothetical protein